MMSHRLWKTEQSSVVHRTESVSMIHHGQSVVASSTAQRTRQRETSSSISCQSDSLKKITIHITRLITACVLQSGGDIGCRLLRREHTLQPDMMELLDGHL